ncbi:MAG: hypothetical protein RL292_444 [Candidatus Parcubacteria bacterium]|jgi:sec-independent protein translocase protein TatA
MFGLGTRELIIIAALAILLFGSKKIPELSRSIVEAIKHMRGAFKDADTTPSTNGTDTKKK